ncbi:MAG: T9SS C-terminal target domain-containing protein [Calditrichaeota bacterium]|nr:MAG: T9SS C-terminal target domain-containing protein [Calditrichota bacterium]
MVDSTIGGWQDTTYVFTALERDRVYACRVTAVDLAGNESEPSPVFMVAAPDGAVRFAVVGDYGVDDQRESDVAALIKSWQPDFVITVGDNNYPRGERSTIDKNIGKYFHEFIHPYTGSFGPGSTTNRFFPALGNHDWMTPNAQPYLDYFVLPNNERYYDFVWGPVHFFVLDSDTAEPDGTQSSSKQANWLKARLAASVAPFRIVYLHHSPFSSGTGHGSQTRVQWPYAAWGASAVISGHDHNYERILRDGIVYFVNGAGGRSLNGFGSPVTGSVVRYGSDYGAMRVDADDQSVTFQFINRKGELIDTFTLGDSPPFVANPIPDQVVAEDAPDLVLGLTDVFQDPDPGGAISWAVAGNSNPNLVQASIAGDVLTLSFAENQFGHADVSIEATSQGKTAADTFAVTVRAVNDAPQVIATRKELALPRAFGSAVVADLDTVFQDVDPADTLHYEARATTGLVAPELAGSLLSVLSLTDTTGLDTLVVTATDDSLAAAVYRLPVRISDIAVFVDPARAPLPQALRLYQNYPNPFNPATRIEFDLPEDGQVVLRIYDILGREVVTLLNGKLRAGHRAVVWDGRDRRGLRVGSGIYVYRLQVESRVVYGKMALVR